MKLGLIAAALFLASYAALNGGFGPQPLRLLVPVLVVVASAAAARGLMRRGLMRLGLRAKPPRSLSESLPERTSFDMPSPNVSPRAEPLSPKAPPSASRGGKARKLF